MKTKVTTLLTIIFLCSMFMFSASLLAGGQALENEDQVLDALNSVYGQGFISKAENDASSTGVPVDPAGDIAGQELPMTWDQYLDSIDALNDQLEKGKINEQAHFEAFQKLYQKYNAPRRFQNTMRQSMEGSVRPVDTVDIDTTLQRRDLVNPHVAHHDS